MDNKHLGKLMVCLAKKMRPEPHFVGESAGEGASYTHLTVLWLSEGSLTLGTLGKTCFMHNTFLF